MYVSPNFKTKKALKEAIADNKIITIFSPGPFGNVPENGVICVEGPHYPEPHKWYAEVTMENGKIVAVK